MRYFSNNFQSSSLAILGLNQKIGGLNKKKFENLLSILRRLGKSDNKYRKLTEQLERLRQPIIVFIGFRDKEKIQDTIVEFPAVDYEYGLVKDGTVILNSETFEMIKFIKDSFSAINKLISILLGIRE